MEVKMNNNNNDNHKRKKFIRLAEYRTKKVISTINMISRLSCKRYYEYDKKQVEKISSAIRKAVTAMNQDYKNEMSRTPQSDSHNFNLDEVDHE